MRELNEVAERAQALFGVNESAPISGNWAKWYHEGIPDGPEEDRDRVSRYRSRNANA